MMPIEAPFKDVSLIPDVRVDLRYASTNNFTGQNLYGDFKVALLHEVAWSALTRAAEALRQTKPGWGFLVFDALRPRSIQKKLFSFVEGTERQPYIADPVNGSIHNYGFAVDLTLLDEHGREVDMGTGFDDFRELSQPCLEDRFLDSGELTNEQVANRKLLRDLMSSAGFTSIPNEWWHFDAIARDEARTWHSLVE